MKEKKSRKADLERKRGIFFQIGLLAAMSIVFYAFTYTSHVKPTGDLGKMEVDLGVDEITPITMSTPPPPPPPPPPPTVVEVLNIVEDTEDIIEDLDLMDSEADKDTEVAVAPIIEEEEKEVEEEQIFVFAEEMPEFPGGNRALLKWLGKNVRYPVVAQENGISGKVIVNFVIDHDGRISNAKVVRGVAPSIDKEALRVVNSMPKWKPGKQRGKAVRVSFTAPINFVLQ